MGVLNQEVTHQNYTDIYMDERDQVGVKIDSGFDFEAVAGKTVLRRAICKCGKESKAPLRQLEDGATTSKMERTGRVGLGG